MATKQNKTGKPKTNDEEGNILSHIIEQSMYRTVQDINAWRGAIMQAENVQFPQRLYLYNLYDEIILDGHVQGIMGQRIDGLLGEKYKITNATGEVQQDLMEMFDNEWFYDFMKYTLESVFWGHSLIQLLKPVPGEGYEKVVLVPRRHVVPEKGSVSVLQGDNIQLIAFREPPYVNWVIEAGGPRDHGLFKIAAPDFIIKKNAKKQWSMYCEIFAMPLRVGYTRSTKQADLKKMADNLKNMGAAAYAVFQDGERIELLKNENKGGPEVYLSLIESMNMELSKLIIRQTMTVEDGSSLSQSEVHERVMDAVKEYDKRLMRFTVKKLLKLMVLHGLVPEGTKFEWEVSIDIEALWKKTAAAMTAGYLPDLKWVLDIFGLPLEKLAPSEPPVAQPKPANEDKPEDTPEPPATKPKKKSLMLKQSKIALSVMADLDERYKCSCPKCGGNKMIKLSADNKRRKPLDFDNLVQWIYDNPDTSAMHQETYQQIADDLIAGFESVFKKGKTPDDFVLNLKRFAAAKTLTMQDALQAEVNDADGDKKDYSNYESTAQTVADRFSSYQDTEYDTVATKAQGAKTWNTFQANAELYPNLTWRTVGDARVRPSHQLLNNLTAPMNSPIWQKYWIGMDYGCRCDIEQTDSEPVTNQNKAMQLFKDAAPPTELQGNPGITKQVFGEQHAYFKGTLKRVDKMKIAA